jgi:hypothetical protein
MIHRRQLPIISPCEGFVPAEPRTDREFGLCARCDRVVHDLSQMEEREANELVARIDAGDSICVAYRTRSDGSIVLRERSAWAIPALLLAACAGHISAEPAGSTCRDANGYEIDCDRPDALRGYAATPDDALLDDAPHDEEPPEVATVDVPQATTCEGQSCNPASPLVEGSVHDIVEMVANHEPFTPYVNKGFSIGAGGGVASEVLLGAVSSRSFRRATRRGARKRFR